MTIKMTNPAGTGHCLNKYNYLHINYRYKFL